MKKQTQNKAKRALCRSCMLLKTQAGKEGKGQLEEQSQAHRLTTSLILLNRSNIPMSEDKAKAK